MNQVSFRELDERPQESDDASGLVATAAEWACECVNDTCVERIEIPVEAYEAVRRDTARFFVVASDEHFWPHLERVVEHHDGYWVVEGTGDGWAPAGGHDPRSGEKPRPLSLHT
jgi:hypothetical protein